MRASHKKTAGRLTAEHTIEDEQINGHFQTAAPSRPSPMSFANSRPGNGHQARDSQRDLGTHLKTCEPVFILESSLYRKASLSSMMALAVVYGVVLRQPLGIYQVEYPDQIGGLELAICNCK